MEAKPAGDGVGRRAVLSSLIDKHDGANVIAVSDVTSLMAMLVGAFLGLLSGLLLLAMSARLVTDLGGTSAVMTTLAAVWIASAVIFSWRTGDLLVVLRRACAVGAVEWLVLALWFRVEALAAASDVVHVVTDPPVVALVDRLSGTPATIGVWVCLVGWYACHLLTPSQPVVRGQN